MTPATELKLIERSLIKMNTTKKRTKSSSRNLAYRPNTKSLESIDHMNYMDISMMKDNKNQKMYQSVKYSAKRSPSKSKKNVKSKKYSSSTKKFKNSAIQYNGKFNEYGGNEGNQD